MDSITLGIILLAVQLGRLGFWLGWALATPLDPDEERERRLPPVRC